jgi:hypothetical protein
VSLSGRAFVNRAAAVSAFGFNPSRKKDLGALPSARRKHNQRSRGSLPRGRLRPHPDPADSACALHTPVSATARVASPMQPRPTKGRDIMTTKSLNAADLAQFTASE